MLPRLHRRDHRLGVVGVRVGDEHGVHLRITDQVPVVRVEVINPGIRRADRGEHRRARIAERGDREEIAQLVERRQMKSSA